MARKRKKPAGTDAPRPDDWPGRLKRLRVRLGLETQREGARRFRVSLRSFASWENGERTPPPIVQELIAALEALHEEK